MVNCDKSKDRCKLRIWAESVIARDGKCLKCGSTHDLVAHHSEKIRYGDRSHRFNVDYGVTLCRKCHEDFHRGVGGGYFYRENTLKFIVGVRDWCSVY